MDRGSSSEDDDKSLSQRTTDKSVSELLSSYYSVQGNQAEKDETGPSSRPKDLQKPVSVSDKDFLSSSFDVEYHFDNILKHNSISDTIAFLRKLERETRQLTAGKQLLIYDNYECLFSALDTIQNINKDLDAVQSNLKTLKSSQIKAASKDITSRYGIRDKFLHISHLSRAAGVFKFLGSLCNALASFNSSNTLLYTSGDEASNVLKYSRKDVLYFCSRLYNVFKHFDDGSRFLFGNYYPLLTELLSRNVLSLLSDNDPLPSEDLPSVMQSLRELAFDGSQLVDFYFFNLSTLLEIKMRNLFINYTNNDFSFTTLCNEVFESMLWAVHQAVRAEVSNSILSGTDSTRTTGFCFFCFDDLKVDFEHGESGLFTSFSLATKALCKCMSADLPTQFVLYYTHASFLIFTYLLTSYNYTLITKDVTSGLLALFERVHTLKVETKRHALFLDQSLKWLMALCVLYLQFLFLRLYDSLISKSISLLNGSLNSDLSSYMLTSFEKLVQELVLLSGFVKDVKNALKNNFDQVFNSLVAVYTAGLKYIYQSIFKTMNGVVYKGTDAHYLDSLPTLLDLRQCTDATREQTSQEFIKMTESRLHSLGVSHTDHEHAHLFSVTEFIDRTVRFQLDKFKFDASHLKTYSRNLLSFLLRMEGNFSTMMGLLQKDFLESTKIFTGSPLTLQVPSPGDGEFDQVKLRMRQHLREATDNAHFKTIFDDLSLDEHLPFLNVLILSHDFNRAPARHFPLQSHAPGSEPENLLTLSPVKTYNMANHFDTFNLRVEDLCNEVISQIMLDYLNRSLRIIRFVLDSLESGNDVVDESIKDFTILLSDLLQDVNLLTMAQTTPETAELNKNFDKVLNTALNSSDLSALVNVHRFAFNTSRDMCLKLFTLHIVQSLSQFKTTYVVDAPALTRFYDGLKQQILIIFKKNLDLFIMQSVWERVLNIS